MKLQYREIARTAKRLGLTFGTTYDSSDHLCPVGVLGTAILGRGWYTGEKIRSERLKDGWEVNNRSARALARLTGHDPVAFAALECGYEGYPWNKGHRQYKVGQRLAGLRSASS